MRKFSTIIFGFMALVWLIVPAAAKVQIDVNLSTERMHVTTDNGQTYDWPVSSARRGYITPDGNYHPQSLQVMHYSHKYHNAPMPHAIFFRGGYAIHGGYSAASMGVPHSHGCVRLTNAHAATLFALVRHEGADIHIHGQPSAAIYARARRPAIHHVRYVRQAAYRVRYVAYRMKRERIVANRRVRVRTVHYVRHMIHGRWYSRRVVATRWQTRHVVRYGMVRQKVYHYHYAMAHHRGHHYAFTGERAHVSRTLAYAPTYRHYSRRPVGAWQFNPLPAFLLTR